MKKIKWKTLGEICEIKTGQQINKRKIFENKGIYPVINSGKQPLGYINTWNTEDDPIGITTRGAGVGSITYQIGKYFRGNLNYSVTIKNNRQLNTRFLYHLLLEFQKSIYKLCTFDGIPALNSSEIKKLEIPLPPLKKQAKIAAVLDKFTELTEELTEELTAREAQYDYYRNMLLIDQWNDKNIKLKNAEIIKTTVGDIIERCSEKAKNDKNVTIVYTVSSEFGLIPSIDYWKKKGSKNKKSYKMFSDDTSNYNIVRKNMFAYNQGYLNIGSIDCLLNEESVLVSPLYKTFKIKENIILPKYLLYFLKTSSVINKIDLMKESGARNKFDFEKWKKIEISIPAIEVQQKIVNILDSFETLVNNIKQGLPREIELRQKHYEYYREKLLTFDAE